VVAEAAEAFAARTAEPILPTAADAAATVSGTATTNDIAVSLSTAHGGVAPWAGIVSRPAVVLTNYRRLKIFAAASNTVGK